MPVKQEAGASLVEGSEVDLYDYDTYLAARAIADLIAGEYQTDPYVESVRPSRVDQRQYPPDRESGTTQGFVLELPDNYSNNSPTHLYTPWGRWKILGITGYYSSISSSSLLSGLEATYFESKGRKRWDPPLFALHSVNGIRLPEPVLSQAKPDYSDDSAVTAWNTLTARYMQDHDRARSVVPGAPTGATRRIGRRPQ